MKLIDKDALVAEIERRAIDAGLHDGVIAEIREDECYSILSFIDTLEVKEVDLEHLEQEVEDFCYKFDDRKDKWYDMTPHDKNIMVNPTWSNFAMQLAKHFFELGMRVNNPITAADRGTAEEIIINLKRVEQDYHINLTKEITWVRNKSQKGEKV